MFYVVIFKASSIYRVGLNPRSHFSGRFRSQETGTLENISVSSRSESLKKQALSCEALSVFDGITVKVQYIGDEEISSPRDPSHG